MKSLIIIIVLVLLAVAWYLFRPEKLIISSKVNEDFPESSEQEKNEVTFQGNFKPVAHEAEGTATVYDIGDGKRVLRFTNFSVFNGPDLHVYLVAAEEPTDNQTVKDSEVYQLGSIKGNIGNQNYELGPDVDLDKFKSVVIWCKRFGVNFAVAKLEPK